MSAALEQAVAALEAQRAVLGDSLADQAIAALRQRPGPPGDSAR